MAQNLGLDNTMSIYVSSDGSSGPTVSINKALLLSALSIDPNAATIGNIKWRIMITPGTARSK